MSGERSAPSWTSAEVWEAWNGLYQAVDAARAPDDGRQFQLWLVRQITPHWECPPAMRRVLTEPPHQWGTDTYMEACDEWWTDVVRRETSATHNGWAAHACRYLMRGVMHHGHDAARHATFVVADACELAPLAAIDTVTAHIKARAWDTDLPGCATVRANGGERAA